jgi:Flp pilus assembly protein TadD
MRLLISFLFALTTVVAVPAYANPAVPLASPANAVKGAAMHNDEGIKSLKGGDAKGAEGHFMEAIKINSEFAEAHFNLGIALDSQGKHPEAASEFKTAVKLAPKNKAITDAEITKKHLK